MGQFWIGFYIGVFTAFAACVFVFAFVARQLWIRALAVHDDAEPTAPTGYRPVYPGRGRKPDPEWLSWVGGHVIDPPTLTDRIRKGARRWKRRMDFSFESLQQVLDRWSGHPVS